MKVTLRNKKNIQQKLNKQLIELQCDTYLNQINKNVDDIKYLIEDVQQYDVVYRKQIGVICAHVAKHYRYNHQKNNQYQYNHKSSQNNHHQYSHYTHQQQSHYNHHQQPHPHKYLQKPHNKAKHAVERLLQKFGLVFERQAGKKRQYNDTHSNSNSNFTNNKRQLSNQLLNYDQVLDYAKYCIKIVLKDDFLQSIPNQQKFDKKLQQIISSQLKSLLLQYIPIQYSSQVLKLYLQESENQIEQQWMIKNKYLYKKLYPFHDIFQIYCSLSYHILNSKKIIDVDHFLRVLERPIMGIIEWPMVLGVRNIYKLPDFTR